MFSLMGYLLNLRYYQVRIEALLPANYKSILVKYNLLTKNERFRSGMKTEFCNKQPLDDYPKNNLLLLHIILKTITY